MSAISPYLTFRGNCEEAFNFYKAAFGGEFFNISRFSDSPPEFQGPPSDGQKIMHVALPIGNNTMLLGSDVPEHMGPVNQGNNVSIAVHPGSEEEADRLFNSLSTGGQVTMPMSKTFWNAYFGMFTDKFGIHWMVNYDYAHPM